MTAYGFRIVGDCSNERRLIDWRTAFDDHCQADDRADVNREAYLSAFTFGSVILNVPILFPTRRCVQGHGGANECLRRLLINLVPLMEIDGSPGVAFEAGVE